MKNIILMMIIMPIKSLNTVKVHTYKMKYKIHMTGGTISVELFSVLHIYSKIYIVHIKKAIES